MINLTSIHLQEQISFQVTFLSIRIQRDCKRQDCRKNLIQYLSAYPGTRTSLLSQWEVKSFMKIVVLELSACHKRSTGILIREKFTSKSLISRQIKLTQQALRSISLTWNLAWDIDHFKKFATKTPILHAAMLWLLPSLVNFLKRSIDDCTMLWCNNVNVKADSCVSIKESCAKFEHEWNVSKKIRDAYVS